MINMIGRIGEGWRKGRNNGINGIFWERKRQDQIPKFSKSTKFEKG
jgi:hypothetical protein